jgi:hypothetical protein
MALCISNTAKFLTGKKKGTKQNRKIAAAILVKPKPLQKEP